MDIQVIGVDLDAMTRCAHYHKDVDIIAIKFFCCKTYFPCHQCHNELANHEAIVWPKDQFNEQAILCGACKHELTISEYLTCCSQCPNCGAKFNSGCDLHRHLYFEV